MAYVNLINQVVADKAEAFTRIRDFVGKRNGTHDYSTTGIGWSLIDSSYTVDEDNPQTGDWVVFHSTGESGDEDLYFKFSFGTTELSVNCYLYWNTTTHAGLVAYQTSLNTWKFPAASTSVPIYIYGDLDSVKYISIHGGQAYLGHISNLLPPFSDDYYEVANCSSALSAGSDVSITVDAVPAEWSVGHKVHIWSSDATTTNIEKAEIKTLVSNTITMDLTKSYASGSKLSSHNGYTAIGGTGFNSYQYPLIDGFGVSGSINYGVFPTVLPAYNFIAYCDPDSMNGEYGLFPQIFGHSSHGLAGQLKDVYQTGTSGLSNGDVFEDLAGNEYRFFNVYSAMGLAIKEV